MQWLYDIIAVILIILSIIIIFRLISFIAVFLRSRKVKGKKISLPPRLQKLLNEKGVLVLYFSSPLIDNKNKKMISVIKIISDEFKNVIKFDITKDKQEAARFNVITAPTTIVINKEGILKGYFAGFKAYPVIKSTIERAMET